MRIIFFNSLKNGCPTHGPLGSYYAARGHIYKLCIYHKILAVIQTVKYTAYCFCFPRAACEPAKNNRFGPVPYKVGYPFFKAQGLLYIFSVLTLKFVHPARSGYFCYFWGSAHNGCFYYFYGSQNKQRLFSCTTLTGCKTECFKITIKTQQCITISILQHK